MAYGLQKDQTFGSDGTLISETVSAVGVYLRLSGGIVGYSENASTAPASVDFTFGGSVQSVSMSSHPDDSSIDVAEASLPSERPLVVQVQGETFLIYRVNDVPDGADQSASVSSGYDVTLNDEKQGSVRRFAFDAAVALNGGAQWADIKAPRPDGSPVEIVKQDLVAATKKQFAEFGTVPAGMVVSHDNGTTRGLWKAQASTTVEPAESSSDWALVFSV